MVGGSALYVRAVLDRFDFPGTDPELRASLEAELADFALAVGNKLDLATPAQVALAWTIRDPGVIAIPKSSSVAHTLDNAGALELRLSERDLDDLDSAFPAPSEPVPLELL